MSLGEAIVVIIVVIVALAIGLFIAGAILSGMPPQSQPTGVRGDLGGIAIGYYHFVMNVITSK